MKSRPWNRRSLAGALRQVLRLVGFTIGVSLVVVASALLIRAVVALTRPYTGSSSVSSLLALAVFAACIAVPSYLFAARVRDDRPTGGDGDREKL